jgi:hypothetical protein
MCLDMGFPLPSGHFHEYMLNFCGGVACFQINPMNLCKISRAKSGWYWSAVVYTPADLTGENRRLVLENGGKARTPDLEHHCTLLTMPETWLIHVDDLSHYPILSHYTTMFPHWNGWILDTIIRRRWRLSNGCNIPDKGDIRQFWANRTWYQMKLVTELIVGLIRLISTQLIVDVYNWVDHW